MRKQKKFLEKAPEAYHMGTHIENMLRKNHRVFKAYVRDKEALNERLCELKNVNFMQGLTPDYTDKGQRSLYLLRYGAAYTVEYRAAYEEILGGDHIFPGPVGILSVGCGACLDKASAFFAMENNIHFQGKKLFYYGIDINRWNIDVFDITKTYFINKRFADITSDDIKKKIDIIFFPKSLCEIDERELINFVDNINNIFWDKVCIVASNRNSIIDDTKINHFVKYFCSEFDYEIVDRISIQKNYATESELSNLWDIFEGFSIPPEALDDACEPRVLCPHHSSCEEEECENFLNRHVVLRTTLFNTTIYCLKRL